MKPTLNFMLIASMVCLVAFLGGCATIMSGDTQKVNVMSETGSKYTAVIDGQKYSVPSIIELKRGNDDKLLHLEECPDQQVLLAKEVNPVFFVNILSGGAFGSTTDYASGSMWQYEQENLSVKCPL